jgi:TetR/AcrR family transcriptional regulator, cholesterol catabolism regulator
LQLQFEIKWEQIVQKSETQTTAVASMSPRQRERRDRIIETTMKLLRNNPNNIEVRDIVDAADVSLATVYRYFGSKDLLFSEAYLSWRKIHFNQVLAAIEKGKTDSERMRLGIAAFIDPYQTMPRMWEIGRDTRNSNLPEIIELRRENEELLLRTFRGAMHNICEKDAMGIVMITIAVANRYLSQWRASAVTFTDVHAAIDEAIRLTIDIRTAH